MTTSSRLEAFWQGASAFFLLILRPSIHPDGYFFFPNPRAFFPYRAAARGLQSSWLLLEPRFMLSRRINTFAFGLMDRDSWPIIFLKIVNQKIILAQVTSLTRCQNLTVTA